MRDAEIYRVLMDGRWSLQDLYDFPHSLSQTYAFAYCFDSTLSPQDAERINLALREYPWGGGYSIVNIFTVLQNQVPPKQRPKITSIQYASPGWIDLLLNLDPIVTVASSVAAIAGSMAITTKSYEAIQKALHNIRINKAETKAKIAIARKREVEALSALCNDLSRQIGFNGFHGLVSRTGGNVEVAAKLLCAYYRRLKIVAEYEKNGKAYLPQKNRIKN